MADTPANGGILVGDMLIVFFCVVSSAAALGQLSAVMPDMAKVRAKQSVFLLFFYQLTPKGSSGRVCDFCSD